MRARRPRSLAGAVERIRDDVAPATLLAAVEVAWPRAVGAATAEQASPVAERDGVITVACRSATWAQELDLLAPELLARLNAELDTPLAGLRFTADAARHERH